MSPQKIYLTGGASGLKSKIFRWSLTEASSRFRVFNEKPFLPISTDNLARETTSL